mgnify:FL=1
MEKIINNLRDKIGNNKVVIACSTGVDSSVLLDITKKALKKEQIIIAHVNHGVRKESNDEETYIRQIAKMENIKLYVEHLDKITNNFEEEARNKRYQFFVSIAKKNNASYILLAHHANDNLETIIMRFLKSSSLKGYAGIEEETFKEGIIIYRPLLKVCKKDIYVYAKLNNIKYFEDETNKENNHFRNRIRNNIVPLLEKENPNLYEAVSYYSSSLLGANSLLEKEIQTFIKEEIQNYDETTIYFSIASLKSKSDYLQKEILFRITKKHGLSISAIEEIMKLLTNEKNKIITKITNTLTVIKEYGTCYLTKNDIFCPPFYLEITKEGTYILPNEKKITVDRNICYFTTKNKQLCYNINNLPIVIRSRQNGDTIKRTAKCKQTGQEKIYTQKISDILTNKKIPTIEREQVLLLVEKSEVKAILGLKVS